MAIRVGQLTVQYAATPASGSDLRVSKVWAQALMPAATSAISANASNTIFADVSDNTVEQAGPVFFIGAFNTFFNGAGDNDWTYDPIITRSVGHALFGSAGDETAEALYREVSHDLFSQSFIGWDQEFNVTHYLGFTDRRIFDCGNVLFFESSDLDEFPSVVTIAVEAFASNTIFTGPGVNDAIKADNISNSLSWQTIVYQQFDLDLENELGLVEVTDISSNEYDRSDSPVKATGFLRQSISFEVDNNDCRSEQYEPLIGSGPNTEYEDFVVMPPVLSDAAGLVLTYPANGTVTDTLNLELPEFGNEHANSFTRVDRTTRGGDRKIYADSKWSTWERLTMSITGNGCGVTIDDVVSFLNTTLGKEIRLIDWESREWLGFIVAPETDISEEQTGFSLDLVFEGQLTSIELQYDQFDIIHGQDSDGIDVDVIYEI